MANDDEVTELLLHWRELRDLGREPSMEELCHRRPDLIAIVQPRIAALKRMEVLLAQPGMDDLADAAETMASAGPLTEHESARVAIPGFEILGELGRGAMGVVYKARQTSLKRLVALKVILAGMHADADRLARFRVEAETAARVQHPNIVQIHEVGAYDQCPYLTLELVDGVNLAEWMKSRPLAPLEAAALAETLARALDVVHRQGIVHRDLKPGNILLASDGTPKITDFGLAKQLDTPANLTRTGAVLGTPSYMAPEQAAGQNWAVGPATDVYALGAMLYEMLTGHPPFQAASTIDTLMQVISEEPIPPRRFRPGLARDLETICLKCLEKEPNRRYPSAAALAEDLRRFQASEPILARPARWLGRAWLWCQRPERILDAGRMTLFLGIILAIWASSNIGFQAVGIIRPVFPDIFFRQNLLNMMGIFLPMILLGRMILARRILPLWGGSVAGIICIYLLPATAPLGDGLFTLLLILAAMLVLSYGVALVACYANRNALRWSRANPSEGPLPPPHL